MCRMQDEERLKKNIGKYLPDIIKGGLNILDIGAGDCLFSVMCRRYNNNCLSIESNLQYVESTLNNDGVIICDALDVFYYGNSIVESIKYDIVNMFYSLCLIFGIHCRLEQKKIHWNYSEEMNIAFKKMVEYLRSIIKDGGIVLIGSHNTSESKKYSDYIIDLFERSGFEFMKKDKDIIHKFRKKNETV